MIRYSLLFYLALSMPTIFYSVMFSTLYYSYLYISNLLLYVYIFNNYKRFLYTILKFLKKDYN
jgi:hypothetical protein